MPNNVKLGNLWHCIVCDRHNMDKFATCQHCGTNRHDNSSINAVKNANSINQCVDTGEPAKSSNQSITKRNSACFEYRATVQPQRSAGRESKIQASCEKWLKYNEHAFLHLSPKAREKIGWPDLVFCINGVPFAVELKTETGVLTEDQENMLFAMHKDGWRVAICRSDLDFIEFVNHTIQGESF